MDVLEVEGIYRDGKVELAELPEGVDEARVRVIFLVEDEDQEEKRRKAGERLLAKMREGLNFGGPPYPTREEIYAERVNRYGDKNG